MTAAEWIALVGVLGALVSFCVGVVRYEKAQKWKRAEFVANEIKELRRDEFNKIAMTILDWGGQRRIDFSHTGNVTDKPLVDVTPEMVKEAIAPLIPINDFPYPLPNIRDCFDHFFEDLERFEQFIKAGLIEFSDIEPYLGYWMRIISGAEERFYDDISILDDIHKYIETYDYDDLKALLHRFGYEHRIEKSR